MDTKNTQVEQVQEYSHDGLPLPEKDAFTLENVPSNGPQCPGAPRKPPADNNNLYGEGNIFQRRLSFS